PGVTEVTFAIEFPATTRMSVSNVTGIAYAARKAPITQSIAIQLITPGTNTRTRYARGWPRIAPPAFASPHHRTTRGREGRTRTAIRAARPTSTIAVAHGGSWTNPNFRSNDPATERKRYR